MMRSMIAGAMVAPVVGNVSLATFNEADAEFRAWVQKNDPVMGVVSRGTFEVADGIGVTNGTAAQPSSHLSVLQVSPKSTQQITQLGLTRQHAPVWHWPAKPHDVIIGDNTWMVKQVGDDGSGKLLFERDHQLIWRVFQFSTELSEEVFPCVKVLTEICDRRTPRNLRL